MATMQYRDWYMPSGTNVFYSAERAFQDAKDIFEKDGTQDIRKKERLKSITATTLDDLIDAVNKAKQHYDQDRAHSRMKRHLEQVLERIHYYGNIMDVLVQHHPEYVSLAWGTMKLLVGAVIEHKKTGLTITDSLLVIADALPRVQLISILYPTESLQRLVASLYACIIKFLLRALRWYEEGPWKRAVHAVTKPVGLQYDDILEEMGRITSSIMAEATAGSQAEQRDMHSELISIRDAVEVTSRKSLTEQRDQRKMLQDLIDLVSGLKIDVRTGQVIAQTERGQIYRSVCDVKSVQVLHVLSSECAIDYEASLQTSKSQRDRRRSVRSTPFWKCRDLQAWNQSPKSSLFLLKVRLADRQAAQDFCTNAIQQLLQANITSLWILKPRDESHSLTDALKSLIHQATISVHRINGDNDPGLDINRFLHAQSEDHYCEILADILQPLKVVYFIVQSGALYTDDIPRFLSCLRRVIHTVSARGPSTIVRILVVNWTPACTLGKIESTQEQRSRPQMASKRKKTRPPRRPLTIK